MQTTDRKLHFRRKARPSAVCRCAAYSFPHRAGGGQCACDGTEDLCGSCHLPAEGEFRDFGIGAYEYWGALVVDTNVQYVSVCCEAGFVKNQPGYPEAGNVSPSDFFNED